MAGIKPILETIGALLPKGIKAWHASPHDFDKFSLDKIGTGQGAASYGPGIYAAESKAVSGPGGQYWDEFLNRFEGPEEGAARVLNMHGFDREKAIAAMQARVDDVKKNMAEKGGLWREMLPSAERQLEILQKPGGQVGPRVYELDIKADPQSFLQWDLPVAQQNPAVRGVVDKYELGRDTGRTSIVHDESRGENVYRILSQRLGPGGPDDAMKSLRDAGIPGIRYADAASRNPVAAKSRYDHLARAREELYRAEQKGAPQSDLDYLRKSVDEADALIRRDIAAVPRTYNYVLNNPELIEILRKYAVPGMVTGGGAITAYEPQGSR